MRNLRLAAARDRPAGMVVAGMRWRMKRPPGAGKQAC
jgi:hypothetical protein